MTATRGAIVLAALSTFGCRGGDPRGDDGVVGAWVSAESSPPRVPIYFHPSGALDQGPLEIFPEGSNGWSRPSESRLWIWTEQGQIEVDVIELSEKRLKLAWSSGGAELERVKYAVQPDGACGP